MSWKDNFPQESRFFETENGILYCADSLEILPKFPSESIGLVITDPPYFVSQKNKKYVSTVFKATISLDFGEWDRQWNSVEEHWEWLSRVMYQLTRVLRKKGWFYMWNCKDNISYIHMHADVWGLKTKTWIVWVKNNAAPTFFGDNYASAIDFCYAATKGRAPIVNRLRKRSEMYNYYIGSTPSSWLPEFRNHPTSKPVDLSQKMIYMSSTPDDIVLDAFAGGGNIVYAAATLGRKWIAIEKDPEYCRRIKNKLSGVEKQQKFDFLPEFVGEFYGESINFEENIEEEEE